MGQDAKVRVGHLDGALVHTLAIRETPLVIYGRLKSGLTGRANVPPSLPAHLTSSLRECS